MPLISDSTQVNSFVSYLLDIKPFHTKLQNTIIEYQLNDNLNVSLDPSYNIDVDLSSIWKYSFVSDGIKTQYRIPAVVTPRYSEDFFQSTRIGVTDEIVGTPGAYAVPNNAALQVSVNGFIQQLGINYTTNSDRTIVQFLNGFVPALNDNVQLNWAVLDRLFIGIQNSDGSISWQTYTLEFFSENSTYDIIPFDDQIYDDDIAGSYFNSEGANFSFMSPIGSVKLVEDPTQGNQLYYVFNFNTPYPLNTTFWIQVEEREDYNGWTQTSITETIKFVDLIKFSDVLNVKIVDFNNYNDETGFYDINPYDIELYDDPHTLEDFSFNITSNKAGYYDISTYDSSLDSTFDSQVVDVVKGYYTWATISEAAQPDSSSTSFGESIGITFSEYDYYDSEVYDDPLFGYDGTSIINSILSPDSTGTVYMSLPAVQVTVFTKYSWNPGVFVYVNNQLYFPESITYPVLGTVIITFAEQVKAVIRLV